MPKRLTPEERVIQYAAEARKATAARNKAIVAMSKAGYSLRAIGEAAGLTHTAIRQILGRGEAAA